MSEYLTRKISIEKDAWATPTHIVDWIRHTVNWPAFDFDPCAMPETAKATHYITPATGDGLRDAWHGDTVWLNPPYSQQGLWLARAAAEASLNRKRIAALVLPSFDAAYWRPTVWHNAAREVWLIEGRIAFECNGRAMPGGTVKSCVVIYDGPAINSEPRLRYLAAPRITSQHALIL